MLKSQKRLAKFVHNDYCKRLGKLFFFQAQGTPIWSHHSMQSDINSDGEQAKETILDPQRVSNVSLL